MRHKASFRSLSDRALAAISVRRALFRACTIALLFLGEMNSAVPDWLRAASLASTGTSYEANTPAVLLLDETVTTVKESGEITYLRRRAFRLMDSRARTYGVFAIGFHKDEPISGLAGWSISAQRKELEVKGKDAIETSYSTENLYDDARRLVLRIPGAEAGSVIGYEYEQKKRPGMLENIYEFQREIPVRRARLTLQLPRGWEFRAS